MANPYANVPLSTGGAFPGLGMQPATQSATQSAYAQPAASPSQPPAYSSLSGGATSSSQYPGYSTSSSVPGVGVQQQPPPGVQQRYSSQQVPGAPSYLGVQGQQQQQQPVVPSYSQQQPQQPIAQGYATPQAGYAAQQPGYATPQAGYAAQQPGYATPQGGYAPQQPGYATPQGGDTTPQAGSYAAAQQQPGVPAAQPGFGMQQQMQQPTQQFQQPGQYQQQPQLGVPYQQQYQMQPGMQQGVTGMQQGVPGMINPSTPQQIQQQSQQQPASSSAAITSTQQVDPKKTEGLSAASLTRVQMERVLALKMSPETAVRKIQDFIRRMARKKRFKVLIHRSIKRRERLEDRDKVQRRIWAREQDLAKMKRFLSDQEFGGPAAVNELVTYTEGEAAVKIQAVVRGHLARKRKVSAMTANFKHRFIVRMQRLFRKRRARRKAAAAARASALSQEGGEGDKQVTGIKPPGAGTTGGILKSPKQQTASSSSRPSSPPTTGKKLSVEEQLKLARLKSIDRVTLRELGSVTKETAGHKDVEIFQRNMEVERMRECENKVKAKLDAFEKSQVTPYAATDMELEDKAQECYRNFNNEAIHRRKIAKRLALAKLQMQQVEHVLQDAKLGDPVYANLNLAPGEFIPEAWERHKRRHLEWYQQHARGRARRLTRKERLQMALEEEVGEDGNIIGQKENTKPVGANAALLELEKILGYDFTPFDPSDAIRVQQRKIRPEDLRLTSVQASMSYLPPSSVAATTQQQAITASGAAAAQQPQQQAAVPAPGASAQQPQADAASSVAGQQRAQVPSVALQQTVAPGSAQVPQAQQAALQQQAMAGMQQQQNMLLQQQQQQAMLAQQQQQQAALAQQQQQQAMLAQQQQQAALAAQQRQAMLMQQQQQQAMLMQQQQQQQSMMQQPSGMPLPSQQPGLSAEQYVRIQGDISPGKRMIPG
ncbi:unnamed protein product [Amoebophrya sp. A25]|nr:unnamed protein product [Amoebophrya sp. A25]|eukprot:GSA25T00023340001.1